MLLSPLAPHAGMHGVGTLSYVMPVVTPTHARCSQVHAMQNIELAELPKEGPVPLSEFMSIQDELRKCVGQGEGQGFVVWRCA